MFRTQANIRKEGTVSLTLAANMMMGSNIALKYLESNRSLHYKRSFSADDGSILSHDTLVWLLFDTQK